MVRVERFRDEAIKALLAPSPSQKADPSSRGINFVALGIVDWRQVSVWPFRIIYAFESNVVTIAMIADARRDFATLLEQRVLRARLRD